MHASVVDQAARQIGAVVGVAIPLVRIGHTPLARADFTAFYLTVMALELSTASL